MYKVTIEDKVTDKFYRATATLDNGNDINITLELTGDRNSTSVFQMFI